MNDLGERIEAAEKKLEALQACMDNVKQEIAELKEVKTNCKYDPKTNDYEWEDSK